MATIAFSLAGQFAGGLIGGPIGATIGRALGAIAGSALDNVIFGDKGEQKIGPDIRLQGSMQGLPITKIYGWARVSGNIIWATELEKIASQSSGAKSLGSQEDSEQIVANFALALCEGEVSHIGRIWADGQLLETKGLNIRFYRGTNDQLPDSLISAKQGEDNTPAYRNICYLVFERLPLKQFGNRIPNISVELCRPVGDLEKSIRAITIIPGASEFGYDPTPRVRIISPGRATSENAHIDAQISDWTLSIDELVNLCPNLKHVAIIVSWFGDDLRCSECKIQPRVESQQRNIKDVSWRVNGLGREEVPIVTQNDGAPAYGGTPSDNTILAAIADLKARGLNVTLYPLIMMDIAKDNSLLDPYTQNIGQPAYPWRGRISCNPAIGVSGTPDKTSAAIGQIDNFIGQAQPEHFSFANDTISYSGPNNDWGYRRMVLHYAKLAQLAGGVEAFIIGSEMKQLSFVRNSLEQFPFVDALVDLAQDVRSILGDNTKIVYAADWSEYSGYQPADESGDKIFHLDKLWASSAIDAIGIDNYMPLSDWRDGDNHIDAGIATSCYDLDYLKSNIAGGEGYDFYYASQSDRENQNRTPISDGAHNEAWIWRYKDLYNWWANEHYNRIGGVRAATPTQWVPQSKPFWFTELGCGAVDKGSNLPSAFADPKSSEDALPYFSSGAPDPIQQRQHLRAHHQYWQPESENFVAQNNPTSNIYGANMLDPDRIYVWTWDARPFPAFPNFTNIWADGDNHKTGHWLTGRLGAASSGELISAMAQDYNVQIETIIDSGVLIEGASISNISSLRNNIAPIIDAASLEIFDRQDGLKASKISDNVKANIQFKDLIAHDNEIIIRKKPDVAQIIGQLSLKYCERQNDYSGATISAISLKGKISAAINSGLVLNLSDASRAAQNALERQNISDDIVEFSFPPSYLALEVGDIITIEGQNNGPFTISEIRDGEVRKITARASYNLPAYVNKASKINPIYNGGAIIGEPEIFFAHIPSISQQNTNSQILFAAYSEPFVGEIIIKEQISDLELARLNSPATIGKVSEDLAFAPSYIWDLSNDLIVDLYYGHLSSNDEISVLANNNRLAIERDDGSWEIIGFVNSELVSENKYRLTKLLRGLNGTDYSNANISAGNKIILLNQNVRYFDVSADMLGNDILATAFMGENDNIGKELNIEIGFEPVKALNPVHLRAKKINSSDDIEISWIRRTRNNGDSWALSEVPLDLVPENYRVEIYDGANLVRSLDSATNSFVYTGDMQMADFGALPDSFTYKIAQISAVIGVGHFSSAQFIS